MWLRMYDYNINYLNLNKNLFNSRIHLRQDSNIKKIYANKEKSKFYFNYINKNINYFFNFYSFIEILLMANYFKFRSYDKVSNIFLTKIKKSSKKNFNFFLLLWIIIFSYRVTEFGKLLFFVVKKMIISFIKISNVYKRKKTSIVSQTS